jgi:hypothetical protein
MGFCYSLLLDKQDACVTYVLSDLCKTYRCDEEFAKKNDSGQKVPKESDF